MIWPVFFFKQKTAYEMRISDWSSDVCSSDLFVPITDAEVAHTGKKLKPIVFEDLIRIAELDREPVAFMMTLPDFNEAIKPLHGSLFPFGWIKLLRWLHTPQCRTMRVPLIGVVQKMTASLLARHPAFLMTEYLRRAAIPSSGPHR